MVSCAKWTRTRRTRPSKLFARTFRILNSAIHVIYHFHRFDLLKCFIIIGNFNYSEGNGSGDTMSRSAGGSSAALQGKPWYYGPISRTQCDTLLNQNGHDGDFLIRDSETNVRFFLVERNLRNTNNLLT